MSEKPDWSTVKISQPPIPKAVRKGGGVKSSPVRDMIAKLAVGDSFETDNTHAQNVRQQFRKVFGQRSYTERAGDEEGFRRFWRKA